MTLFNNSIAPAKASSGWPTSKSTSNEQADNTTETKSKYQTRASKDRVHLDTLRVPRASELVAERLRSLIIMGEVAQGASLPPEKELVKQLGVSRATLREALRLLEAEGLITTKSGPKGGIVVQRPNATNLTRSLSLLLQLEDTPFETVLEARRLLEPLCANLAAERASSVEITQLKTYVEAMRESVGNVQQYVEAQVNFHLTVMTCAHNDVLRLYTTSVAELISTQTARVGLSETEQITGVKTAEGILNAIVHKNGQLAARRTEAHLRGFEVVLMEKLAKLK